VSAVLDKVEPESDPIAASMGGCSEADVLAARPIQRAEVPHKVYRRCAGSCS